ncbi:MAG: ComEC/Rec2 family competence protein [Firmicutes bacterium]|nr:ComEC/Rec2 family competence protein [Bacillota bacterium]
MKRPFVYMSVFLAAGIFFGRYAAGMYDLFAVLGMVIAASAVLYKINNDKVTLIMPVVYMTGIVLICVLGEKRYDIEIGILKTLRENMTEVFYKNLPQREAGIITAMITGDKSGIEKDVAQLYRGAGIYHILAISGLHVGLIAYFLKIITDTINKRYGRIFIIVMLVIYAVFTGGSSSVVRAVIMTSVIMMSSLFKRDEDFLSAVAFSAIVILLFKPSELFNMGFQYSFTAVTAIGLFANKVEYICGKNRSLAYIINSLIVYFSMKIISVYYLGYVTFVDMLSSIVFIPLTGILVGISAAAGVTGLFSVSFAGFLLGAVYYILKFYEFICTVICEADIFGFTAENIGVVDIALLFACMIAGAYMINGHYGFEKKRIKYFACCMALFTGNLIIKSLI